MDLLIEARNLTKVYGSVIGVNDVEVRLERGVHGLLGPNGAGKSTFLKLITGQLRPSEGTIQVFGQDPWNNTELYRRIGFCPEQDALWGFLTALQMVELLARMGGLQPRDARAKAEHALELVGAQEYMRKRIDTFSRGMRQRTKMAQALVHDPEFLILDEPLTGTDPVGRRELIDLIHSLKSEGRSILVSSHVLHEVQATTERFLLILGGRVLAVGAVSEIRALINTIPHRIQLRASRARPLARELAGMECVHGVDLSGEEGAMTVLTREPARFYLELPAALATSGAGIEEMSSPDDSLEAVFDYLVGAGTGDGS